MRAQFGRSGLLIALDNPAVTCAAGSSGRPRNPPYPNDATKSELPLTVLQYVLRTRQSVVLSDALEYN
jgi:hypothetical protein